MTRHLFQAYGIELEYMVVRRDTLDVFPVADEVFRLVEGSYLGEHEDGTIAWSNELALHVIELKTNGPAPTLDGLASRFHESLGRMSETLSGIDARLMPGAMHPWMDPHTEARLWPHDYNAVYQAFNQIFDCRGHGWSNLQSMHINLPFSGDDEFGRLHAAIRFILPLLPALAASSPIVEGKVTGLADSRLEFYRFNCRNVPSVTGRVIPERVYTKESYEGDLLSQLYRDIAPHDPDAILREEWLNARGAIARFDRDAIEIRVVDIQECPAADIAIAKIAAETLRGLTSERWGSIEELKQWDVDPLAGMFETVLREGENATVSDETYLRALGMSSSHAPAREVWQHLADAAGLGDDPSLRTILDKGTLSSRIVRRAGTSPTKHHLRDVYAELCDCLDGNRMFL
jgi:gamma-glutamyl:cysteine ligase YbdK (ATP-grasp superfamily)